MTDVSYNRNTKFDVSNLDQLSIALHKEDLIMRHFFRVIVILAFISSASSLAIGKCEPSIWGGDDEIGNANLISPQSVLKASRLIKSGKTYSLGLVVDANTPAYPPRGLSLLIVQPGQQFGRKEIAGVTYNDDVFQGWFGIGSQIDGLGHVGNDRGMFYNCMPGKDFADIKGLTKFGIEKIPPIVARGIVLDMARYFDGSNMELGQSFTVEDLRAVEVSQGTIIQDGDVVLFHTGWTDAHFEANPAIWGSGSPGIDVHIARYLAKRKVIAVGADTFSVEAVPAAVGGPSFPAHGVLLQENGIYILEAMNTGPLVRDDAFEFLFVLGQAKIRGAVQMIINPVAIR